MSRPTEVRAEALLLELPGADEINAAIWEQYQALRDASSTTRSHYFEGRYENIYIDEQQLPCLQPVLEAARAGAAHFLRRDEAGLSVGFWFNEMGPGHVTLPHRHDEDDELASAVYYVTVPENSGRLVLRQGDVTTTVVPRAGRFVFFRPDVLHEVTENKSDAIRLSLGMNFGVRRSAPE